MEIWEGIALHKDQEKPVKLLLTWAGSDKWYLFASVFCAFLSGLFVIGPYVGIYHLMAVSYTHLPAISFAIVDFPEPELPTNAVTVFGFNSKLIFFSTSSLSYANETFSKQ